MASVFVEKSYPSAGTTDSRRIVTSRLSKPTIPIPGCECIVTPSSSVFVLRSNSIAGRKWNECGAATAAPTIRCGSEPPNLTQLSPSNSLSGK